MKNAKSDIDFAKAQSEFAAMAAQLAAIAEAAQERGQAGAPSAAGRSAGRTARRHRCSASAGSERAISQSAEVGGGSHQHLDHQPAPPPAAPRLRNLRGPARSRPASRCRAPSARAPGCTTLTHRRRPHGRSVRWTTGRSADTPAATPAPARPFDQAPTGNGGEGSRRWPAAPWSRPPQHRRRRDRVVQRAEHAQRRDEAQAGQGPRGGGRLRAQHEHHELRRHGAERPSRCRSRRARQADQAAVRGRERGAGRNADARGSGNATRLTASIALPAGSIANCAATL